MKHVQSRNSRPHTTSRRGLALRALALGLCAAPAAAQFTDTNPGLPGSLFGCVVPGDYDHDGDVDVLVMGSGQHDTAFTTLFRNSGGVYTDSGVALLGLMPNSTSPAQSAAWSDFDGDGDLDLAITGLTTALVPTTKVYRNDGSVFTSIGSFLGEFAGAVTWADYDGDGDPDLLVTGVTTTAQNPPVATRLYRNDAGTFTLVTTPFHDVYLGPVAWADVDGDGDLDVLLCGVAQSGALEATLWLNTGGGTFVDANANLPGLDLGFARFGDLDGDGDPDLVLGGNSNAGYITRIYRNDPGVWTDLNAGLLPVIWSAGALGDFDHDGDLDILVCGYDPAAAAPHTSLYRNNAGSFVDTGLAFHDVYLPCADWLDADLDGDLDFLIAGNEAGSDIVRVYKNTLASGSTFCFGSPGAACPCANMALLGRGCANSGGQGAVLNAFGSASLANDTLVLSCAGELPSSLSIFLQGTTQVVPAVFGDGLRCIGGNLKRLYTKNAIAGVATAPAAGEASVSARSAALNDPLSAGALRYVQTYYRDPSAGFCPAPTGSSFNISSGVTLTWAP